MGGLQIDLLAPGQHTSPAAFTPRCTVITAVASLWCYRAMNIYSSAFLPLSVSLLSVQQTHHSLDKRLLAGYGGLATAIG